MVVFLQMKYRNVFVLQPLLEEPLLEQPLLEVRQSFTDNHPHDQFPSSFATLQLISSDSEILLSSVFFTKESFDILGNMVRAATKP